MISLKGPIARATFVSLAIQVSGIALGVVQAVLTARLLGPEGYGVVAYVFSLSFLFGSVALLGTNPLAVREVSRLKICADQAALNRFLKSIRLLTLSGSLFCMGVLALLMPHLTAGDTAFQTVAIFALLLTPVFAFIFLSQGILRGDGNVVLAQVPFQLVRPAITVLALIIAWSMGHSLGAKGYLIAVSGGSIFALALALRGINQRQDQSLLPVSAPEVWKVARQASPFFFGSILALLMAQVNTLMLAWWTNAEETGLFQPIARIAPLVMLGVQAAGFAYAPRISTLWSLGDVQKIAHITRIFTATTTGFAVLIAAILLGFKGWFLGLFGEAFIASSNALWWVVMAQIVCAACGPVGMLLHMSSWAGKTIVPQLFGLSLNLGLGALLIPEHGALGSAIAMSFGIVTTNLAALFVVHRQLKIDPSILGVIWTSRQSAAR